MPPVILAIVAIGSAVIGAVGGTAFLAGLTLSGFVGVTLVAGVAVIAGGSMLVAKLLSPKMPGVQDTDKTRQVTARGTVEPQKIIYGEALVSGPLTFVGVSGVNKRDLHHVVALAGHEVSSITDIHFDDEVVKPAHIDGSGNVTTGTFGPVAGVTICKISKYLGTATQVADVDLVAAYERYTPAHQGKGIAYIHTTWTLTDGSQEVWDKYTPRAIKALVRGRLIYDPRLDTSPGANPTNASYIAWSDNPALCVADYLMNTRFGMGIAAAKIGWAAVVTAADACDVLVAIPTASTEKRFTANGVLFATDQHLTSINKILTAMNGSLVYSGGVYYIRAGVYEAPTESLNEDDLTGALTVKTSVERSDRFNTVGGVFIDPKQNHKSVEFNKQSITAAVNRDNGETLERQIDLPFTNSEYMAQRIANKIIQLSDQQTVITFPANLGALRVAVGDRVNVSIAELSWTNVVFRCMGWSFGEEGVSLTLALDDAGSYADPIEANYTTVSEAGVIAAGFPGVPGPQNLAAVPGIDSIGVNWTNPVNVSKFGGVALFASPTSAWSGAVEIARGMFTSFVHSAATTADPIGAGDQRYYWVRAFGTGSTANINSDRNPDNDASTINATAAINEAQIVEWANVADGGNTRPANNATVGARAGTNLTNAAGTVVGDSEILNAILAKKVLEIELESGDVLDLETGLAVDIQNLGDVAIWSYGANVLLQGNIANINSLIVDITAGIGDVYVQASAPVAGVGGVPNPIVTSSRWYDSDDSNSPYYWDSSSWVSLLDPRIGNNVASIATLNSSLTTTNTNVTANAGAISTLDTTVVKQGDATIVAITGDITALETTVNDGATGTAANAAAVGTLQTRVTSAETAITSSATDITALEVTAQFATKIEGEAAGTIDFEDGTPLEIPGTDAVGVASSSATRALDARVIVTETGGAANASDITTLQSGLATADTNITANATAATALTTRVTTAEGSITSNSGAITTLQSDLTTANTDIAANATAATALTTRVTAAEGNITTSADDVTTLQSGLTTTNTNVTANATAVSGLTTRVTSAEGTITSQSADITTLETTVNDVTTGVTATSTALGSLTTRVTAAEGVNTSQATDITTLQSGLTTTNGDVTTNATALSGLDTRVTTAEGTITSQSADITTLQSGLTTTNTNVTANATAATALTTRVTSAEGSITSQATAITSLTTTVGDNAASITTQAVSIAGIEAQYSILLDVNGNVTGIRIINGATTDSFDILSSNFKIVDASNAANIVIPFSYTAGVVSLVDTVVNGNLITTGSITAESLILNGTYLTAVAGVLTVLEAPQITDQAETATNSDYSVVTGATKPANNATVGATAGTNLKDVGGVAVNTLVRGVIEPQSFFWNTYEAGGWSPSDTTQTITVRFFRGSTEMASRLIDATLDNAGAGEGDIAVVAGTSTGEANTVSITGSGSAFVSFVVTHTASGITAKGYFVSALPGYSGGPSK